MDFLNKRKIKALEESVNRLREDIDILKDNACDMRAEFAPRKYQNAIVDYLGITLEYQSIPDPRTKRLYICVAKKIKKGEK